MQDIAEISAIIDPEVPVPVYEPVEMFSFKSFPSYATVYPLLLQYYQKDPSMQLLKKVLGMITQHINFESWNKGSLITKDAILGLYNSRDDEPASINCSTEYYYNRCMIMCDLASSKAQELFSNIPWADHIKTLAAYKMELKMIQNKLSTCINTDRVFDDKQFREQVAALLLPSLHLFVEEYHQNIYWRQFRKVVQKKTKPLKFCEALYMGCNAIVLRRYEAWMSKIRPNVRELMLNDLRWAYIVKGDVSKYDGKERKNWPLDKSHLRPPKAQSCCSVM